MAIPNLSLASSDQTSINVTPTAQTGAKYFGTSLAATQIANPNAKTPLLHYFALAGAVGLIGFYLYKKRG